MAKKLKRDIEEGNHVNKDQGVEDIINKYCDKIQPLYEKMRLEVSSLGYKLFTETSAKDGKLEIGYRKKY